MAESINLFDDDSSRSTNHLKIEGSVITTFFQSNDSFYKVLLVKVKQANFDWNDTEIVVTGDFADVTPDTDYVFYGQLIDHPKYGQQFRADNYETNTPTSRVGLITFLSGDQFPGIGKKTAEKVVDDLGDNLISEVMNQPEVLKPLGLTNKQNETIIKGIQETNGAEQVIIGLNSYGFGSQLASKIYNRYHEDTLKIIQANPYQLVEDIQGISFKKADQVAQKMGIQDNSEGRIRAGIMTALKQLSIQEGGTYTLIKNLLNQTFNLLNDQDRTMVKMQEIANQIVSLGTDHKIIGEGDDVYLKDLYDYEWEIADDIKRLKESDESDRSIDDHKLNQIIEQISSESQIHYDDSQIRALRMAMHSSLFLLTGGPGTGKTTIIKGIISLYAELNQLSTNIDDYEDSFPFLLAAPTGRAAKRMKEATGVEASTIHRLLGLNGHDENEKMDTDNQLTGKLLIIDEMSMVDTYLFHLLMKAVPDDMKVILVGDKDQLPSVGPGQVFQDLLDSNLIPKIELNTIHRQKDHSTITSLAHDVRMGQLPNDFTQNQSDRSFIRCNADQMASVISQVVKKADQRGFDPMDIQVLAPMYRGEAGINNLNKVIQSIMNPKKSDDQKEVSDRNFNYRIGDKVLQLVNDSEKNVFNGDIGKIVGIEINPKQKQNDKITIAFDEIEVTYDRKNWEQITLAYCTSIHKAQGCEFKMVILPMVPQYSRMLKRNLLYTAITRASKYLILMGNYESFERCVESKGMHRFTGLESRVKQVLSDDDKVVAESHPTKNKGDHNDDSISNTDENILTDRMIRERTIDPMIGMQGISPSDFQKNDNA